MNLTPEHLASLRAYLKEFTASSPDGAHQEQVNVVNSLIPALVDTISDEELTALSNDMWGFVLTGIIHPTKNGGGELTEEPVVETAVNLNNSERVG